jgi:hypothetical protein
LNTMQAFVQQGRVTFGIGWWAVHALALLLLAALFWRRIYAQRWVPRWVPPWRRPMKSA